MKVVTWNLGTSSGYTARGTASRLDEIDADIALLQEADLKTPNLVAIAPCTKATSWGSAILAKHAVDSLALDIPDDLRPWLRIAAVNLSFDGVDFLVASVHPHFEAVEAAAKCDGDARRYLLEGARWLWHCDVAFGILNHRIDRGRRFIIGGDWNNARAFQKSSVPDARFSEAFFDRAREFGWCEVGLNADGTESPTYRKGIHPYQLDHLFVDATTFETLRTVTIASDVLDAGLSDHAPIVADFALGD